MNFLRKQMKWVMAMIVVAFLLSTFLMYEGRTTRRTPGRNPDGSMSDYEVASINGRSLMRSELERRLGEYLSNYSTRSVESVDMPAIYQAVLDQAILESQLAKEVEEKGIRVSDADADRAMKEYADRHYPTREMFYQVLANSGIKLDDYKRSLARQMAVERVVGNAIGEVVISEDEAVQFYEIMKNVRYGRPEGYNLQVANFKTSDDADFFRSKLLAGEKWADVVSSDALASRDIINISTSPIFLPVTSFMFGRLSEVASLDVGVPSEVMVMSSEDYAVLLKDEHVDAETKPYDEVSDDVRATLTQQEESRRITDYQNALLKSAQVVINDTELFARTVVSEDNAPAVEDVIPELSQALTSAEPEAPAVVEEAETPAVVEEEKQEAEAPAVVEEAKPEEAEAPATETPAVVEAEKQEAETLAVVEEAKPAEVEAPAVVEEVKPAEEEKPAVEEAPAVIEETPAVEETATPEAPTAEEVPAEAPAEPETAEAPAVTSPDKPEE